MCVAFDQCRRLLLAACMICRAPCAIVKRAFCGTLVIFEMMCKNGQVGESASEWVDARRQYADSHWYIQQRFAINSLKYNGVAIFTKKKNVPQHPGKLYHSCGKTKCGGHNKTKC